MNTYKIILIISLLAFTTSSCIKDKFEEEIQNSTESTQASLEDNSFLDMVISEDFHFENSHVKSIEFLLHNPGKHAFNVGTGVGISVLDAIKTFEQTNKLIINYSIGPKRDGDIEQIYANNRLVKEKLGWEAKETLEEAMISAWNWEKLKE